MEKIIINTDIPCTVDRQYHNDMVINKLMAELQAVSIKDLGLNETQTQKLKEVIAYYRVELKSTVK